MSCKPCEHKRGHYMSGRPIRWYNEVDWEGLMVLIYLLGVAAGLVLVILKVVFRFWNG